MTAPQQNAASAAQNEAGNVAHVAANSAASVAGTAASAATDVAGVTKEQAANVLGEGLDQAKDLISSVREQVAGQVGTQHERLTGGLRTVSTQMREGDTSGVVGQFLSEASQRLESLAAHLERTGPQGVVQDLRSYAKRNPGSFLLGAALAGLVSGRVAKGLKASSSSSPAQTAGTPASATGTAAANPLAGVTVPVGTGAQAGYAPAADPRSSYAADPVSPAPQTTAYPASDGPAPIRYDDPARTSTFGGLQ